MTWLKNLKQYNAGQDAWCIPRRGTAIHAQVKNGTFQRQSTSKSTAKNTAKANQSKNQSKPQQNVAQAMASVQKRREKDFDKHMSRLQDLDIVGTKDERRAKMKKAMQMTKAFRRTYQE